MQIKFKTARKMCNLKILDAANLLGISQPTLSAWENGRKSPTIANLMKMSELYKVSVDFLLGMSEKTLINSNIHNSMDIEIPLENLRLMHGKPVWSLKYGWMIVDSINQILVTTENIKIPFESAKDIYYQEDRIYGKTVKTKPLRITDLKQYNRVWVEPISTDLELCCELRGWYKVMSNCVENDFGNRFMFSAYESKWLGFNEQGIDKK